ncbi:MAG: tetratricopeptide repeat protein [Patescibacteria group bacterium]
MKIYFNKIFLKSWTPFAIIAVAGFLLYAQTLFFDFTYLDDNTLILDNQSFLSDPTNFLQAFKTDVFHVFNHSASYYRPLLTISLMVDYQLGGITPFVYHFSNIILHILAACLLFVFLKKMKYKKDVSFLFSLIFLTHPVLTQAVAWIPGRNDSLMTVFILSSFICFIYFLERTQKKYFIGHLLFFLLAIFTKETALFALPLFIFYAYFLNLKKKIISKEKILVGWVAVLGLWFIPRYFALDGSGLATMGNMIKSILFNLSAIIQLIGKSFFPFNLSVLPIIQDTSFVYGIVALSLLAFLFYRKKNKRRNYILFGLFWFFLFLLPSFIRFSSNFAPDFIEHRLYLPIIGLFIILLELNPLKNWRKNNSYYIMILVIVVLFSVLTFSHSRNFSDKFSFWQNAVKNSPHHPLAHRNLGAMYYLNGNMLDAEKEFKASLAINPSEEMAHNNLGLVYANQNKFSEAENEYKKELEINPRYDNAYYNLGLLYYKKNQIDDTEHAWKKALEINPNNLDALFGLLNLYYDKKDYKETTIYANEIFRQGFSLPPKFILLNSLKY